MRFLSGIANKLWGLSSGAELRKFLYLAAGGFCLFGSFSPLKPLKESLFINMVGSAYLPVIKGLSAVLMLLVVMLYSKVVDLFSKRNLFYVVLSFYVAVGLLFVVLLSHPTIGVANTAVSVDRWVAWGFYLFVESYLTVMMSLFWSFANDVTSASSAKKGYGMIMFGSQTGAFSFAAFGSFMVANTGLYVVRVPLLLCICMGLFALLGFFIWRLTAMIPGTQFGAEGQEVPDRPVGILEGLFVVVKNPYVTGIFSLMLLQEIIVSLMHFQQAYLAEQTFAVKGLVTNYYFQVNLLFQLLSCVFSLLGTSYIHRKIGTRASLMSFPILLIIAGVVYFFVPNLYTVTLFIVLLKGLHYAFNQPVRETLYIPTSRDIKYKAKAWIDVAGLRGAKALGFSLTGIVGHSSSILGLTVIGFLSAWTFLAGIVGKVNERAVRKNIIIR